MKFVYQIGQVPLYGTLVNDIDLSEDRTAVVKETQFQQSSGWFNHVPYGRRLLERPSVTIKGTLVNNFLHTASRLKALLGLREVPLIVFEKQHGSIVRWLFTTGTVESVDDNSHYGEDFSGNYLKEISLKMKVDPTWSPLLSWYWENRPNYTRVQAPTTQVGVDTIFAQPERFEQIPLKNYYQQWPDTLSKYTPFAWPYLYQRDKGYGTDYAPFRTFYVNSSEEMWAAPPRAFYAFTKLLGQGTLTITVTRGDLVFTSSIDLAATNTQLINRGLNGLMAIDEMFVGLTDPFCCWISRNGSALANFVPQWTYTGAYPGEVFTGLNEIVISGLNTTGQFAANIQFGAL